MTLLENVIGQMHSRVEELRPLVVEFNELSEALDRLHINGVPLIKPDNPEPKLTLNEVREMAGLRPLESERPVKIKRGRGRPKGSGPTRDRLLRAIRSNPGRNINQLAKALRMQPNYLYRALPAMEEEGKIYQMPDTKEWWPAARVKAPQ